MKKYETIDIQQDIHGVDVFYFKTEKHEIIPNTSVFKVINDMNDKGFYLSAINTSTMRNRVMAPKYYMTREIEEKED